MPEAIHGVADWLQRDAPVCPADAGGSLDPRLANTIRRNTERPRAAVVATQAFTGGVAVRSSAWGGDL